MKKLIFLLLGIFLLFPFISAQSIGISNCAELQNMNNNQTANYHLLNDINCSGVDFIPIGIPSIENQGMGFTGSLEGNNYTIYNLIINFTSGQDYSVGLFSLMSNAVIQNLKLSSEIYHSNNDTGLFSYGLGSLIGTASSTNLTNVHSESNFYFSNSPSLELFAYVGGIAGDLSNDAFVKNVSFSGNIDAYNHNYVGGLFGSAVIITIEDAYTTGNIIGATYGLGGLVGISAGTNINNASSNMNIVGNNNNVGGIAGDFAQGIIQNSYATGNITGIEFVGGLVGSISNSDISNSYATGNITGDWDIGGLVGFNSNSDISNSYSLGNVNGIGVGGLVGNFNTGNLYNSYSRGNVYGQGWTGGLVGTVSQSSPSSITTIINSYATGNVTRTNGIEIHFGGFVGSYSGNENVSIINSYSTGSVQYDNAINPTNKGFIGEYVGSGLILNSYWDMNTSNQNASAGINETGKTTLEMYNINTYNTWDIVLIENFNETSIWYIDNGNDYPRLYYEFTAIIVDTEPPTFYNAQHNNNITGDLVQFAITFNDSIALEPNGYYIFSTNITGVWINATSQFFIETPQTVLTGNYLLPSQDNVTVGYKWYATDNAGNFVETDTYFLVTQYECYVNEDCLEGYECLNNICVLIPEPEKDYPTIFINIALIIIIVTFFFVFITESKFVKMRNLK